MMGVAKFVKELPGTGEGKVFKLDPPLMYKRWGEHPMAEATYVWVSAADTPDRGPETYIFHFDLAEDNVTDWGELPGSFTGEMNIEKALNQAGYEMEM